jgi:hypothetical protein
MNNQIIEDEIFDEVFDEKYEGIAGEYEAQEEIEQDKYIRQQEKQKILKLSLIGEKGNQKSKPKNKSNKRKSFRSYDNFD